MPNHESQTPQCWSCQREMTPTNQIVLTTDEERLPVLCCRDCWESMTVAERLEVAQRQVRLRALDNAPAVLYHLAETLRKHDDEQSNGPSWLRN